MKRSAAMGFVFVLSIAACAQNSAPPPANQSAQRANPASTNCIAKGGKLSIERNPTGGEFGVCLFEDNRQCEEWALLRGQCPVGGIHVAGFATPAARYCGITGGTYAITADSGTQNERGNCALPSGKTCAANAHFAGQCNDK